MHRLSHHRPSPAMIVAVIALIFSLGGVSYAAITLPAGSVGTKQLKKNAVVSSKVKNGSLTLADISSASLSKLGRVAFASAPGSAETQSEMAATVSLTVPRTGFVLVQGWITASDANGQWGVRLWDDASGQQSAWTNYVTGNGTYSTSGNTAVFPVTAGVRTFSVHVRLFSATNFGYFATITAQFIPYSGTGSPTLPPTSAPTEAEQIGAQD